MLDTYQKFAVSHSRATSRACSKMIFDGPNLNAVDETVHSEIPYVWP